MRTVKCLTSKKQREENVGAFYAYRKAHKLDYYIHSHPDLLPSIEETSIDNSVPGTLDMNAKSKIQEQSERIKNQQNKNTTIKDYKVKNVASPKTM